MQSFQLKVKCEYEFQGHWDQTGSYVPPQEVDVETRIDVNRLECATDESRLSSVSPSNKININMSKMKKTSH